MSINNTKSQTFLGNKTQPTGILNDILKDIEKEDSIQNETCHYCSSKEHQKLNCKQCKRCFCFNCISEINKESATKLLNSIEERSNWLCFVCLKECPCKTCVNDKKERLVIKAERKCLLCGSMANLFTIEDLLSKIQLTQARKDEVTENNLSIGLIIKNSTKDICKSCFNTNQTVNEFFKFELENANAKGQTINNHLSVINGNSNKIEESSISQAQKLSKDLQKKPIQFQQQQQQNLIRNDLKQGIGLSEQVKSPIIQPNESNAQEINFNVNATKTNLNMFPDINMQDFIQNNTNNNIQQFLLFQNQQLQQQQEQTQQSAYFQQQQNQMAQGTINSQQDQMKNLASLFNLNVSNERTAIPQSQQQSNYIKNDKLPNMPNANSNANNNLQGLNNQLAGMLSMMNDIAGKQENKSEEEKKEDNSSMIPKDFNEIYSMIEEFKKQIHVIQYQSQLHKMFIIHVMKTVSQLLEEATNQQMMNGYQMYNSMRNNPNNQLLNYLSNQSPANNQDFQHIFNDIGGKQQFDQAQRLPTNVNSGQMQSQNDPKPNPNLYPLNQAPNQMKDSNQMNPMNMLNMMGQQQQFPPNIIGGYNSFMNPMTPVLSIPANLMEMANNSEFIDLLKKASEFNANRQQQQPPFPLGGLQIPSVPIQSNNNKPNSLHNYPIPPPLSYQNYPPNIGMNKLQNQPQGNFFQQIPPNLHFLLNQQGERNNSQSSPIANAQTFQMLYNQELQAKDHDETSQPKKKEN